MLNNTKSNGCTCSPEQMSGLIYDPCNWCLLASDFSDTYKELYGVRPRFYAEWSEAKLARRLADLYDQAALIKEPVTTAIPTSGDGWTLITDDDAGLAERLEGDCY
jgi:hypothetical protein